MSKINKTSFAALLLVMLTSAIPSHSQTIEELTDAARKKRLSELQKSTNPQMPVASMFVGANTVSRDLVLLAIYGVGESLVCELSDEGTTAKYRVGDKLPSGWIVGSIQKRTVTLKHGKQSKVLSFWAPTEIDRLSMPLNTNTPLPMGR